MAPSSPVLTSRFAPSPTGLLHKGHAYSALLAYDLARRAGGRFLLRLEDIDSTRCNAENSRQILEDLAWLGLEWEEPVRLQSLHLADYQEVASQLVQRELLYPCFCTRKDILREIERSGQAPHGIDGPLYPGICRRLSPAERAERIASGEPHALRLDLGKALAEVDAPLRWQDAYQGEQIAHPERLGDAVLVRKDIGTSYHLAVVVDDALQGVTDIVRGEDLFEATHLHRLLQALLDLPSPLYHHHPLLTDASGQRLAKRDRSLSLKSLRETGVSPEALCAELGFPHLPLRRGPAMDRRY